MVVRRTTCAQEELGRLPWKSSFLADFAPAASYRIVAIVLLRRNCFRSLIPKQAVTFIERSAPLPMRLRQP